MPRCVVDRKACVEVPALPLQVLVRAHEGWEALPVAVVDRDRPQGIIQWINEAAFRQGIRTGMRYANGLSLASQLRAGEVSTDQIEAGHRQLQKILLHFSPHVEAREAGVFFVDASGLHKLYPSLQHWGDEVVGALKKAGFVGKVTAGFARFSTFALSRSRRTPRVVVHDSPEKEREAMLRVPLARLGIEPSLRDALDRFGVRRVGEFLELSAEGVRRRFGAEAHRLHRMGTEQEWQPLQPQSPVEAPRARVLLDEPEARTSGLLFLVKRWIHPLLTQLADRHEGVSLLKIRLDLDDGTRTEEQIRPATPTLDVTQLMNLVRLRLEQIRLGGGVTDLEIELDSDPVSQEQLQLFAARAQLDCRAAERALARIRAEMGDDTVVRPRLAEGHLPEARYCWEPISRVTPPRVGAEPLPDPALRPTVRRIQRRPVPLRPCGRNEPDGWLLRGVDHGSVERFVGPYVVSGGWWASCVHREYHYAWMRNGDIYWIYYDRRRRRWFLHGQVE